MKLSIVIPVYSESRPSRRSSAASRRVGVEPEITLKIAKLNCRVYEVPISYAGRDYSEGKKIA